MCIIHIMDSRQIIKKLKADGFELARVKGSHHQYVKGNLRVTVIHPKKDFADKTLRSMYRQAGWKWPPK